MSVSLLNNVFTNTLTNSFFAISEAVLPSITYNSAWGAGKIAQEGVLAGMSGISKIIPQNVKDLPYVQEVVHQASEAFSYTATEFNNFNLKMTTELGSTNPDFQASELIAPALVLMSSGWLSAKCLQRTYDYGKMLVCNRRTEIVQEKHQKQEGVEVNDRIYRAYSGTGLFFKVITNAFSVAILTYLNTQLTQGTMNRLNEAGASAHVITPEYLQYLVVAGSAAYLGVRLLTGPTPVPN